MHPPNGGCSTAYEPAKAGRLLSCASHNKKQGIFPLSVTERHSLIDP